MYISLLISEKKREQRLLIGTRVSVITLICIVLSLSFFDSLDDYIN